MFIKIYDKCVGCGACVQICPEVFDINTNQAIVNQYKIIGNESDCLDAVIICPVNAIDLYEN